MRGARRFLSPRWNTSTLNILKCVLSGTIYFALASLPFLDWTSKTGSYFLTNPKTGKRQTEASVRAETQNRVRGVGGLVRAMAEAQVKPQVFVSASSVGTYGYAGFTDVAFTENSPPRLTSGARTPSPGKRQRWRRSHSASPRSSCSPATSSMRTPRPHRPPNQPRPPPAFTSL